jgi:hypothetical protein
MKLVLALVAAAYMLQRWQYVRYRDQLVSSHDVVSVRLRQVMSSKPKQLFTSSNFMQGGNSPFMLD